MQTKFRANYDTFTLGSVMPKHDKFEMFLKNSELLNIPSKSFIVYGSFLRSFWSNEKINNINIAFTENDLIQQFGQINMKYNSIEYKIKYQPNYFDLITETDFSICQLMYYDGKIICRKNFFEVLASKLLLLNKIDSKNPLITLLRAYKYHARGYHLTAWELLKITNNIKEKHWKMFSDDFIFHSDGMVY